MIRFVDTTRCEKFTAPFDVGEGGSFWLPIAFYQPTAVPIEITEREIRGTAYLRPLLELQTMLWEPKPKWAVVAWSRVDEAQLRHNEALQFTPEGLNRRGRFGLEPRATRERCSKLVLEPNQTTGSG